MLLVGIVGAVGIFLSHPAVFVLTGAAVTLAWDRKRRDASLLVLFLAWAALVALNYFVFLRPLELSTGLQKHWADLGGYPPMSLIGAANWLRHRFLGVFADFATMWLRFESLGLWPARLAAVLSLTGFVSLWRRNRFAFASIATPIVATILAAALRKYPFEDRLILFLVPLFIITMAQGAWAIWHCCGKWWPKTISLAMVGLVLLPTFARSMKYLFHPPGREEIKPVLAFLEPRLQPGDVLYVYHAADAAYLYYREQFRIPDRPFIMGSRPTETVGGYEPDRTKICGSRRVWLLFSHVWERPGSDDDEEQMLLNQLNTHGGKRQDSFIATGASVYLYDLSAPPNKESGAPIAQ